MAMSFRATTSIPYTLLCFFTCDGLAAENNNNYPQNNDKHNGIKNGFKIISGQSHDYVKKGR
jgi:hypothetical protein